MTLVITDTLTDFGDYSAVGEVDVLCYANNVGDFVGHNSWEISCRFKTFKKLESGHISKPSGIINDIYF